MSGTVENLVERLTSSPEAPAGLIVVNSSLKMHVNRPGAHVYHACRQALDMLIEEIRQTLVIRAHVGNQMMVEVERMVTSSAGKWRVRAYGLPSSLGLHRSRVVLVID
ncbi:MAG: hypothetical protein ACT4OO_12040 [Nitrospiraceae bacterium]